MAKHIRRRPGRKRKAGDRKPCGRLRYTPPEPNATVIERRKALMGSDIGLHNAENPLSLAFARGWVTERQFRAGAAYARIKRAAQLHAPGLSSGGLCEAPERGDDFDPRPISQLPDEVIAQALDNIALPPKETSEDRTRNARKQWQFLCDLCTMDELTQIEFVCVEDSWPQWLVFRVNEATADTEGRGDAWRARFSAAQAGWEQRFTSLASGLDKIAAALFKPRDPRPSIEPISLGQMNSQQPRTVTESTTYVDGEGNAFLTVERVSRKRRTAA